MSDASERQPVAKSQAQEILDRSRHDGSVESFAKQWGESLAQKTTYIALVIAVVIVVAAIIIWNRRQVRQEQEFLFNELVYADTTTELKALLETTAGKAIHPYVYLRLVESLEADLRAAYTTDSARGGESEILDPADLDPENLTEDTDDDAPKTAPLQITEALIETMAEFVHQYEADEEFAEEVARFRERIASLKADREFLREREQVLLQAQELAPPDAPAPRLVDPTTTDASVRPLVLLQTEFGDIAIELYYADAPNTVANFLSLVGRGFYNIDGPGGSLHREGTRQDDPPRLVFGDFPFPPESDDDAPDTYADLVDTEPRAARIDPKWEQVFDDRSIGYTIRFEHSGANRPVTEGTLVMALASETEPNSAATKVYLVLDRAEDWDGRYVVFGAVTDAPGDEGPTREAGLQVARQVPLKQAAGRDITVAIEGIAPLRVHAKTVRLEPYAAVDEGGWARVADPDYVIIEEERWVMAAPTPQQATHLRLHPRQFVALRPADGWYLPDADTGAWEELDTVRYVPLHPSDLEGSSPVLEIEPAIAPDPARPEAPVVYPLDIAVRGDGGELLPHRYQPMVRYPNYPVDIVLRDLPPETLEPFELLPEAPVQQPEGAAPGRGGMQIPPGGDFRMPGGGRDIPMPPGPDFPIPGGGGGGLPPGFPGGP